VCLREFPNFYNLDDIFTIQMNKCHGKVWTLVQICPCIESLVKFSLKELLLYTYSVVHMTCTSPPSMLIYCAPLRTIFMRLVGTYCLPAALLAK